MSASAVALALLDHPSFTTAGRASVLPVLVLLHLAAALACLGRGLRTEARPGTSENPSRTAWLCLAGVLAGIAAARASGLVPMVTQLGRDLAAAQGWYESRRPVQAAGLLLVLAMAVILAGVVWPWIRRQPSAIRVTGCAIGILLGLLLLRTVSLHHVETVMGLPAGGLDLDLAAELAALILALLAAARPDVLVNAPGGLAAHAGQIPTELPTP